MRYLLLRTSFGGSVASFLKKASLGLLTALAISVSASNPAPSGGWVASTGTFVAVALKQPCPAAIAEKISAEIRPLFSRAEAIFPDGKLVGCWAGYGEVAVFLWENGDYGYIPQNKFRLLRET